MADLKVARQAIADENCPICQMMGEEVGPVFWHLDGCNMDDDFPFSFHRTREEWEAERRGLAEFDEEFARRRPRREQFLGGEPPGGDDVVNELIQ